MPKQQGDTLLIYQDLSDGIWIRVYCCSPVCSCPLYKKTKCDSKTCRFYKEEVVYKNKQLGRISS